MIVSVVLLLTAVSAMASPTSRPADATGSYAVVVSRATWNEPAWREVVDVLRAKHDAAVIVWDGDVTAARSALAERMPRYACFVARPEEAGRNFVVAIHRMTRRLDDDPYTDVIWGILTGYEPADALRIAGRREPLIVRTALGGAGALNLDAFDAGVRFHEDVAGERFVKEPGKPTTREAFSDDSTEGIVQAFNELKPDLFLTSGHATERDWQIGYNYRDGQLRCENGQLFGLDTQNRRFDVRSPNPKVFLPVGNCLIGHIPGRDCMATALMHSAGVEQMFGYTAVTFYGYIGWGILDYFEAQRDRFTLAESFFCVSQALLHTIQTRHPRLAQLEPDSYDLDDAQHWAERYNLASDDEAGLLWDRDVVAFYGDPAWEARRAPAPPAWDQKLDVQGDEYTLTVTARADGQWPDKPIIHFLPHRVAGAHVTHNEELMPIVTDSFVLVPFRGPRVKGKAHEIKFRAETPAITRTSADQPPVFVTAAPPQRDAPPTTMPSDVELLVPEAYRPAVRQTLAGAGPNQDQLIAAIRKAPEADRAAVCFLIANLPPPDATQLSAEYLLENTRLALEARNRVPWGRDIPEPIFLNYVLPYANINERRDNWRRDFFERFSPLVRDCRTPSEAALKLNNAIFGLLGVQYHASLRPKPDQSPYESMKAGYASCTGLSILLVDACRAVGVPARFVGTPQWTGRTGNHSWVEIWDGQWHYVGAAEPDPAGLDHAWFTAQATKSDASQPMHRIYAASFRKTDTSFPLVWDLNLTWVCALDVTKQYTHRAELALCVLDRPDGRPVPAQIDVHWQGELYARVHTDGTKDVTLNLPLGERFDVTLTTPDGSASQTAIATPMENPGRVVLHLAGNRDAD
ncbi:MAG: transglutaminase domain-containing protein [Phycisphaerae bacterium]|nr:transglutaminase domain-containing protein [Phycisphaerae bacterium]